MRVAELHLIKWRRELIGYRHRVPREKEQSMYIGIGTVVLIVIIVIIVLALRR